MLAVGLTVIVTGMDTDGVIGSLLRMATVVV
jgi:hypothetical protein